MNQDWDPFALLLIDVQKDFWTEEMSVAFPDYEQNVCNLLDVCRREQIDVVHLRAQFKPDKSDWMLRYKFADRIPCIEGTPGADIFPCAGNQPTEKLILKQTFDGFLNPDLHTYLCANNKRFLLLAGLVTSVCVLLTAASAAQQGYLVSLVEDCCADEPVAHKHTLGRYPFIFSRTTVDQLVSSRDSWLKDLGKIGAD
jgi:nicotinamidase-related amidase